MTRRLAQSSSPSAERSSRDAELEAAPAGMVARQRLAGSHRYPKEVVARHPPPEALMTYAHTMKKTLQWFALADADVLLYAAKVTVWGRWFIWFCGVALLAYRPGLWYPDGIEFVFLSAILATVNGALHYRLLTNRPVTWRWMVGLSAMDIALITGNNEVADRFDNYIFIPYYPALGAFAVIFSSIRLNIVWVAATAATHCAVSFAVGAGLDLDNRDERALAAHRVQVNDGETAVCEHPFAAR